MSRPSVILDLLDATYREARQWHKFAITAIRFRDMKAEREGLRNLLRTARESSSLVQELLRSNPPTPDEMMEGIRDDFLIEGMAIELLLTDHPGVSYREYDLRLAKAKKITASLRRRAKYVNEAIRRDWPEYMTTALKWELGRMMKAKP